MIGKRKRAGYASVKIGPIDPKPVALKLRWVEDWENARQGLASIRFKSLLH